MKQTEAQFASAFEDLLNLYHWRWTHFRPARTDKGWRTSMSGHPGFPDYVCVRPPRVLFVELKSDKGKLSEDQKEWRTVLVGCRGTAYHVWRPSMWPFVEAVLR